MRLPSCEGDELGLIIGGIADNDSGPVVPAVPKRFVEWLDPAQHLGHDDGIEVIVQARGDCEIPCVNEYVAHDEHADRGFDSQLARRARVKCPHGDVRVIERGLECVSEGLPRLARLFVDGAAGNTMSALPITDGTHSTR
jgi:hypothetical protein